MNKSLGKKAAQEAVRKAIDKGIIKNLPCEKCGKEQSVAHHKDYNKPFSVKFLCYSHHTKWHKKWDAKPPMGNIAKLNHYGMFALGMQQLGLGKTGVCVQCGDVYLCRRLPIPYCIRCVKAD